MVAARQPLLQAPVSGFGDRFDVAVVGQFQRAELQPSAAAPGDVAVAAVAHRAIHAPALQRRAPKRRRQRHAQVARVVLARRRDVAECECGQQPGFRQHGLQRRVDEVDAQRIGGRGGDGGQRGHQGANDSAPA